jgi:pyruvate/2-oxoglutarate dehydrogenase complex dihydrolipoamide dehydrogenase (E3) component
MAAENSPADRPAAGVALPAESTVTTAGRYPLVVLGGDPAGIVAAEAAARRGVRVALLLPEPADLPATEPSELAEQIRHVQARTGCVRPTLSAEPGIVLRFGQPRFTSPCTLELAAGPMAFGKAIIATGGSFAATEIEGASQVGCLTPEMLTSLGQLPRRLAVVGCGAIACQWAQAFGRFGSQVHLIAQEPAILPDEDPAAAAAVRAALEEEDIRFYLGCEELAVEQTGSLRGVVFSQAGQKNKLLVDEVLWCGLRRPNIAALGLESAGVACSELGVVVNDRLQTTQRRIFAAGEVCGAAFASPQARQATARLAAHNACSLFPRKLSRLVIPRCIYTDPQIAQIGLTHRAALQQPAERQIELSSYRVDLAEADDSLPPRRRRGFIAVEVAARTGRVLGATVVAEDADELLAPLQVLISRGWPLAALVEVIPCRPSRGELWQRLAEQCAAARLSFFRRGWTEKGRALLRHIRGRFGGRT